MTAGAIVDVGREEKENNNDGHGELPCFSRYEEGRLLSRSRGNSGGAAGSSVTKGWE